MKRKYALPKCNLSLLIRLFSIRCELIEILKNSGMNASTAAGAGPGNF